MTHRFIGATAILAAIGIAFPAPVHAYLDPGTGSIILQGLLAAIAAGSIAARLYWSRLVGLFRGKHTPLAEPAASAPEPGDHDVTTKRAEQPPPK